MNASPQDVVAAVAEFARVHGLFPETGRLLVGFSGGADSTALLLVLRRLGLAPVAVHFHHGLRGAAAAADAEWCAGFCRERGIPFERHDLAVPAARRRGESLEQAARRCRLEFWRGRVREPDRVALGHHLDDCLEDLFLRLGRGVNSGGATGLRPRRRFGETVIVRPLLGVRRQDIEAFLQRQGIRDWRRDASNADRRFRRNRVRHELLPLIREIFGSDAGLVRSLEALREDAACLDAATEDALPNVRTPEEWRDLPDALLPRVLRRWLQPELGADFVPPRTAIERLRDALRAPRARAVRVPLGGGAVLWVDAAGVRLARPAGLPPPEPRIWPWRREPELPWPAAPGVLRADVGKAPALPAGTPGSEWFAAAALADTLLVRAWEPGDRMIPFGARSPKKLQDLFTDAKVPRDRRRCLPVVVCGEAIIWTPGVRRAEFGRVAPGAPAVRLRWKQTDQDGEPSQRGREPH